MKHALRQAFCSLLAAAFPAFAGELQLRDAAGGALPDVVVEWPSAPAGAWQGRSAVIDQLNTRFVPFVSVVAVGSTVNFPNSDDKRHHVYSFSDARTFELRLYRAGDAPPVMFDRAGLVVLGCNVHDNMKAYLVVSDAPYAAVSDARGRVAAPAGAAEGQLLRLWHPLLGHPVEARAQAGTDGIPEISLPLTAPVGDPQAPRAGSLEERLKRFKRNAS